MINNLTAMQSVTTGLGDLTLSVLAGYQDFASAFGVGAAYPFYYFISHSENAEFEVGIGYMTNGNQMVRQTVLQSSQGQQKINFSGGVKQVSNDLPAALQVNKNEADVTYAPISHAHVIGNVTGLQAALDAKAPIISPSFSGTVTLPAGQVVNGVTLSTAEGTSKYLRGDGTYQTVSASLPSQSAQSVLTNATGSSAVPTALTLANQTLLGRGDGNVNDLTLPRNMFIDEDGRVRTFSNFGHFAQAANDGLGGGGSSGSGASQDVAFTMTATIAAESCGVIAMGTGATASGAAARGGRTFTVRSANDRIILRARVLFDVAPNATEDYRFWQGIIQGTSSVVATNPLTTTRSCALYYDRNYTNWQVLSRASSTNTFTDTGVAFAINTWYELEMRIQGGAVNGEVNVKTYLNGALMSAVTDFDRTQVFGFVTANIQKIAGLTARLVYLDYSGADTYATTNY
jgi:hypothetical protein